MFTIGCKKDDDSNNDDNNNNDNDVNTVTDYDGNVYHYITIGTQVWMVENLKVTHYRNGDAISNVTDNTAWGNLTTGAYCCYNNNSSNTSTYGLLYNGYAATDSRGIAPTGWHVATHTEWKTLVIYLGGSSLAGGKMKEAGTAHWTSQSSGTDNSSGFTALPSGYRYNDGTFWDINNKNYLWTSTKKNTTEAYYRYLSFGDNYVNANTDYDYISLKNGFSIRCIKD